MERENNCNDMRLVAAILVVISHSFTLANGTNDHEPIFWLSQGQVTAGGLSVFTFFVLSGCLITRSFERSKSVVSFMAARVVRIIPALAVVLFVTAFMLGPLLTDLSGAAYFESAEPIRYLVRNVSLLTYVENLPGVLVRNPLPGVMNGSLWTLHIEAFCYATVLLLGLAKLLNRFVSAGLVVAGMVATTVMDKVSYPLLLVSYFMAGVALYHWRIGRTRSRAVACAALLIASMFAGGFVVAFATAGAYLVCYLAFAPPLRRRGVTGVNDLSYGTYIWAFPVQQTVAHQLGAGVTWYADALISLPIVLVLAWTSWNGVEKHALKLKSRFRPDTLPRTAEAAPTGGHLESGTVSRLC